MLVLGQGRRMGAFFRAVAVDFDGTLTTESSTPADSVLAAIARARARGQRMVLVTGRIASELRVAFPAAEEHFDAIVAENGAVLIYQGTERPLIDPLPPELANALRSRDVDFRLGNVLIALNAADDVAALQQIHRLGLDTQLIYNRSELMLLPAGVTKATGLAAALEELGISRHNTMAVGDAENDHAFLATAELGVAVENAVPSVKAQADVVTLGVGGEGVVWLLDGPLATGAACAHSRHAQLRLGLGEAGQPVQIPASQLNVLIAGRTGGGKSYVAGLLAERAIAHGYSVLVVDPEGDHKGLVALPHVARWSASEDLPRPADALTDAQAANSSIVIDLSGVGQRARNEYLDEVNSAVTKLREDHGMPHWVIVDEAQQSLWSQRPLAQIPMGAGSGYCLVSWQPDRIDRLTLSTLDAVILVGPQPAGGGALRTTLLRLGEMSESDLDAQLARLADDPDFYPSLLITDCGTERISLFEPDPRLTKHIRHWHKYTHSDLPVDRWFYFRDEADNLVATAADIRQFDSVISQCPPSVISHHCKGHELSAWIQMVFADRHLGSQIGGIEDELDGGVIDLTDARVMICDAVRSRYGL